jgi:hypothetical protein
VVIVLAASHGVGQALKVMSDFVESQQLHLSCEHQPHFVLLGCFKYSCMFIQSCPKQLHFKLLQKI